MGAALPKGGPAGLVLGFVAYGTILLAVNECFGAFHLLLYCYFLFGPLWAVQRTDKPEFCS